jgi:protein-S-isoprenylcysteine O-methyltransferase Ste14
MSMEYSVTAGIFLLCLAIRATYELVKERRKTKPETVILFAIVLTAMCTLWISWFALCSIDPYRVDFPGVIKWAGFSIFLVGMVLAIGAFIQLRGVENVKHLVTTGLFRKIRHPMYLGFIFWIIGWSLFHGALLSLLIGTAGIVSTLWWRHLEDGRLEGQFGEEYRQYRLSTWI